MSSEGFLKEMQTIGEKFLLKLQKLPKADPVEIVSFCVVLLFIDKLTYSSQHQPLCQVYNNITVLVLMIIACSCCCYSCCSCDGRPDHRRRKIQVRPTAHS